MSARKEVACTYLHHTKPHILSLFFLSPTLSLCLSLLSFERQATHRPHRAHEAAAEHYHLPDMGQQKPKPYGYIGRGRSTILSHADTQTLHSLIYMGTNDVDFRQKNNREANKKILIKMSTSPPAYIELASHMLQLCTRASGTSHKNTRNTKKGHFAKGMTSLQHVINVF